MNCLRYAGVIGAILIATSMGCGDNSDDPPTTVATGAIQVFISTSPGDVAAIHIGVTGPDFTGSIDTDLVQQPDLSWIGTVLEVPPGVGRTVTAEAFDGDQNNTFEGIATNITVVAGGLVNAPITLTPTNDGTDPGVNTPPHFVATVYPASMAASATASLSATAADPDVNTQLTYTWSVLQGGGTLSDEVFVNQLPGNAVSTLYTPAPGYNGFVVIQVAVSDGSATAMTSFPISILGSGGVVPMISFDILPDLLVSSVERQSMMPGGTSQIQFALTNPVQPWTPATMHVNTSWSDTCGGSFDAAPEDLDLNQGDTASRTVTYTAPPGRPASATSCQLTLSLLDPAGVHTTSSIVVWIDPPMVMFLSSATVPGNAFGGSWLAADAFCQNLADAPTSAAPSGLYHALISFDQISAKDRLIDAPYIRINGTPIARNKAELFNIDLLNSVLTNENNAFTGVSAVYTGTNGDGSKGPNCLNWTSAAGGDTANAGINAAAASPGWTNAGTFSCAAQLPIYCVQQPGARPAPPPV